MEKKSLNNNYLVIMKKTRKELKGIIFTRACCSIGIIFYHYFGKSNGNFKLLRKTANSTFGFIFVTSFFCISGTVLYYNYPKINSIKSFYFKRWKSIFPSFYICYFYYFLKTILTTKTLFFRDHWTRLFFTVIGMDNYLRYRFKTYNLIGEWFLGAIIIIYILYPLLLWMMNINILIINIIVIVGYILMYMTNYFQIMKDTNIITCVNSFYFGMLGLKFQNLLFKNKRIFICFLIIFILLYFFKLKNIILIWQIQGISLYIILVQIGQYIMLSKFKAIFIEISILSYNIFLIHHKMIYNIIRVYNPTKWYLHIVLLGIIIILTMICSKILLIIVNIVNKTNIIKKIESYFLNT